VSASHSRVDARSPVPANNSQRRHRPVLRDRLDRVDREGQKRAALTPVASRSTSEVLDGQEERDHDLRAALFGIEASAEGLSRHREQLTPRQFDELAAGLAAEVRRLRSLLDGCGTAPRTFDLADAIDPVVASGRASGLDVRSSVPRGIEVIGRRDATARVVLGLLDNARTHAPGVPVEVRASVCRGASTLYVEDRGKGVSGPAPERLFERGVRGRESTGSGLGLYIARRLMTEQGGSIGVRSRPGGGASFALRFRRARQIRH
jgi:signal transduction histidine kinase